MRNLLWKTFVRGAYKAAGLDSPYSQKEYGANWSKQRKKCLDRDNRSCRVCRKTQEDIGRELSVHHITPRSEFDNSNWREYNDLENLISLCPSCHGSYEGKFTQCDPNTFAKRASEANA